MFSTQVSFIPKESCSTVTPPIIKGERTSVWVKTLTQNESEIRMAAVKKFIACYGIDVEGISVGNQFEY
jgi:hypothetical protein